MLFIVSIAVAFWDWAVSIGDEYKQIWKKPLTTVTAIYVWTRYGFFVSSAVAVWVWCVFAYGSLLRLMLSKAGGMG